MWDTVWASKRYKGITGEKKRDWDIKKKASVQEKLLWIFCQWYGNKKDLVLKIYMVGFLVIRYKGYILQWSCYFQASSLSPGLGDWEQGLNLIVPQQQYEFSRKLFLCFKMIAPKETCAAGLGNRLWHNSLPHPGLKSSFLTQLHGPITRFELAAFPRDVGTAGMILPFEECLKFRSHNPFPSRDL